jgi:hypothetical protein
MPSDTPLLIASLGFCFWTTLTALHPAIFFFSVYNMGVGGHEALLVIQVLALGATFLSPVRRFLVQPSSDKAASKSGTSMSSQIGHVRLSVMIALHVLCLAGMGVWMVNDQLTRLLATAASCTAFAVLYTLEWGRAWECQELDRKASAWIVGLLLSSAAKYANHR